MAEIFKMLSLAAVSILSCRISNEASLKPSLFTLVNLTSACLPIQMQVRSLDRNSTLRKSFIRLVNHDDNEISIVALAAIISTGMSEEFNKMVCS